MNNSRTAWPTLILKLFVSSCVIYYKMIIIIQKDADNFEIEHQKKKKKKEHKTC